MSDQKENKSQQIPVLNAAALKYDGENAPQLIAKGKGLLAQQIIETAKEHDVHIHSDPVLVKVLEQLELGDEVPEQMYLAVAKIIAFAYFLRGKHPDYKPQPTSDGTPAVMPQLEIEQRRIDNDGMAKDITRSGKTDANKRPGT